MRILLAEDERDLSEALVTVLQKNNYSVDAVYNGQDAVEYMDAGNYDAAIFDVMMPKKDGLEALRELRSKGVEIPILLLTAKTQISDRVDGLDSGADDYLTKPFAIDELLARIRTMTRRKSEGRSENHIVMGNVKLDLVNSEIISEGGSAFLGNKEFQMMEIFMNNKDQFISAERIFERIWGYDSDADMSVIWVNISNLRKKLRKIGANTQVNAKRNTGYRLVVIDD
ncbi:response regulator transcription factor [Clostridium grantii]|uniref:Stage 0 sporulation protein A homolog n=1 Tax=Clostridium grantii DSM 8605 TaxID=1121316 RepID=A0A1M5Y2N2_9CLOT|nr:response regulator transcription factor [Clostridium grantii]SHI06226.1 DNA-binding response regulator, OmpR family, contains REC and winged-helix (wHTH) domain [Clostridium grantii DSM 8605]